MKIAVKQLVLMYCCIRKLANPSTLIREALVVDGNEHRDLQLNNMQRVRDFVVTQPRMRCLFHAPPLKAWGPRQKREQKDYKSQSGEQLEGNSVFPYGAGRTYKFIETGTACTRFSFL